MVEATKGVRTIKINGEGKQASWITLPNVSYYDLYVNGNHICELHGMPFSLRELAIGYLVANAYVDDPHVIEDVVVSDGRIDVSADSEFDFRYKYFKEKGVNPLDEVKISEITSRYEVSKEKISEKIETALARAVLSTEIPGVTFAFVSDYNGLFFMAEDVYPDSALYKALGKAVFKSFDFRRSMVVVGDTLLPEYVVSGAFLGVPILGSLRGVASLSVNVAENLTGQTIFLANSSEIFVLSHPQRII